MAGWRERWYDVDKKKRENQYEACIHDCSTATSWIKNQESLAGVSVGGVTSDNAINQVTCD